MIQPIERARSQLAKSFAVLWCDRTPRPVAPEKWVASSQAEVQRVLEAYL